MKRLWTASLVSLAFTALLPVVANAATFRFAGPLNGAQEVPPKDTPATGSFQATLVGDENQWTFNYQLSFSDLLAPLDSGHIHLGGRGETGMVVHGLENLPSRSQAGMIQGDWSSSDLPADIAPSVVFNRFLAEQYYFNLHTSVFPTGEIRGQIEQAKTSVPEPTSLLGLAIAGSAIVSLRRRQLAAKSE